MSAKLLVEVDGANRVLVRQLVKHFVDHANDVGLIVPEVVQQRFERGVDDLQLCWGELDVIPDRRRHGANINPAKVALVTDQDASERVRNLLLRGDNLLKHGRSDDKAREAFEEARRVAAEAGLDQRIRDLIEHRLEQLG